MGADLGICHNNDVLFRRSDANADGQSNLSDAVFVLRFLFISGPEPLCLKSGDIDDNGRLQVTDAIYLLNFLFLAGQSPLNPFPDCGSDSTIDAMTCDVYPACSEGI